MDLDHCGVMMTMLQGFAADAEAFGQNAYHETGPGQNFLSTQHTLRHYASANFQPTISEAGPFESWCENGSPTVEQRATAVWKQMLDGYKKPSLDDDVLGALNEFVASRKASMPDEWY